MGEKKGWGLKKPEAIRAVEISHFSWNIKKNLLLVSAFPAQLLAAVVAGF